MKKAMKVYIGVLVCLFMLMSVGNARETGWVMFNGERTMPVGWYATYGSAAYPNYHVAPVDESQLHGFDYIMPYYPFTSYGSSTLGLIAYLDFAVEKGVKVVIDLHTGGGLATVAQITERVNIVKNHPGVYGYYLEDEPDLRGLDHAALKTLYDTVKALDPTRAVFIGFGAGLSTNIYLDCTDIVLAEVNCWQLVVPDPGYNNVFSNVAYCANAGKSYMVIPYPASAAPGGYPSAAMFRFWVFGSIAAGAGGIMPWIFEGDPTYPNNPSFAYWAAKRDEVVYPTMDILKDISPVLLRGQQGVRVTDNIPNRTVTQPFTRTFKDGYARLAGDAYDSVLIGVYTNPSGNPIPLTFTLTGLASQNTTGTVVGEDRTITLTNGSFTDTFAPLGTHVYQFRTAVQPVPAGTVVASSVADTEIVQNASTTNYGTWYYMQSDGSTSGRVRSLVKFSLPTIPSGQIILSATLGVYANTSNSISNTTRVHKVLTDWQETVVTWANFNNGGQSGTNYAADSLFLQTLNGKDWLTGDVTSAVRDWYATPANNKGLILISNDSTGSNFRSIFTREASYSYPTKLPYLSITYCPSPY